MRALNVRLLFVATLTLTVGLAGCASGGGGRERVPGSSTNHIVRAELEPLFQLDAYQAIQQLRPNWLRPRAGQEPEVMVDGARQPGRLSVLRQFRAQQIEELHYLSGSDATTRYGTGFDGGAILITTRR